MEINAYREREMGCGTNKLSEPPLALNFASGTVQEWELKLRD